MTVGYRLSAAHRVLTSPDPDSSAGSTLLAVLNRLHLVPKRFGLPRNLPLRRDPITSGDDVYLFTGCVMDVWQREVHAAQRVLETAGYGVTPTADLAPCCGALHSHAGPSDRARQRAEQTIAALSNDDRPILVDSAGCGAAMKEYGHLLATPEAEAFARRVFDITNGWPPDSTTFQPSHRSPPVLRCKTPATSDTSNEFTTPPGPSSNPSCSA